VTGIPSLASSRTTGYIIFPAGWKIADFDGSFTGSSPDAHDKPSVNKPSTSS
jgi:hypothetical protein